MTLKWWDSERTDSFGHSDPLLALQLPSVLLLQFQGGFSQRDNMTQDQLSEVLLPLL